MCIDKKPIPKRPHIKQLFPSSKYSTNFDGNLVLYGILEKYYFAKNIIYNMLSRIRI